MISHVPEDFVTVIIVPLFKDKTGNLNDTSNCRSITLVSVISKLLVCILLEIGAVNSRFAVWVLAGT